MKSPAGVVMSRRSVTESVNVFIAPAGTKSDGESWIERAVLDGLVEASSVDPRRILQEVISSCVDSQYCISPSEYVEENVRSLVPEGVQVTVGVVGLKLTAAGVEPPQ